MEKLERRCDDGKISSNYGTKKEVQRYPIGFSLSTRTDSCPSNRLVFSRAFVPSKDYSNDCMTCQNGVYHRSFFANTNPDLNRCRASFPSWLQTNDRERKDNEHKGINESLMIHDITVESSMHLEARRWSSLRNQSMPFNRETRITEARELPDYDWFVLRENIYRAFIEYAQI